MGNSTEEASRLVPVTEETGVMMPVAGIADLAKAVEAFNEIKTRIILQHEQNYVQTTDKRTGQKRIFLKRSAWRQIQLASTSQTKSRRKKSCLIKVVCMGTRYGSGSSKVQSQSLAQRCAGQMSQTKSFLMADMMCTRLLSRGR